MFKSKMESLKNKFDCFYNKNLKSILFINEIIFICGLIGTFWLQANNIFLGFSISKNYKLIRWIIFSLFILVLLLTKRSLRVNIKYLFYIIITIICDINTNNTLLLTNLLLLLLASKEININRVLSIVFYLNSFVIISSILFYTLDQFLGLNILREQLTFFLYRGNMIRHAFYFCHPNTFSNFLFWTFMIYVYLNFDDICKNKKIITLQCLLLSFFIYTFPNTRNVSILFLLLPFLLIIYSNERLRNNSLFKFVNTHFFMFLFVFSFLCLYLINCPNFLGELIKKFNELLSNRILIGNKYLQEYGISFFGNYVSFERNIIVLGKINFVLDNYYYYLVIRYGIVISVGFCYIVYKSCINFLEKKDFSKLFVIICFLLYSFVESTFRGDMMQLSFPLLLLAYYL